MIRVFKSGAHAHRSPLSYPALAPLFQDTITQTDRLDQADMYVFSHILDIQNAPKDVVLDWRLRRVPIVLLSEEPFWDTIWGKQPLDPVIYPETAFGPLPVVQLSYQTSDIFNFDHIPYYLLTNHRFANAYQHRFSRNAMRSAADWQADFATRPQHLSFLFERRAEARHHVAWPDQDVRGLCAWRTEMADGCQGMAGVEHLGHSWNNAPIRWSLPDWHMDKLVMMDGRTRFFGAIENTHQPQYVTEKFFDAFACGAIPIYAASPGHSIHQLGLPEGAWVNVWDMSPEQAVDHVMGVMDGSSLTKQTAEAFQEAQNSLAVRFNNTSLWLTERARLAQALPDALQNVLDQVSSVSK